MISVHAKVRDPHAPGLPLAEPFATAVPGLAIPLFTTAGRIPGGPNLVYPVRLVLRVALLSDELRFDQVTQPVVRAEGPNGSLGTLDDLASLGIADRQNLRARYVAMLDRAAVATAGGASDDDIRELTRSAFERLREKALAATYAALAPILYRLALQSLTPSERRSAAVATM